MSEAAFVPDWLARLLRTEGIVAVQVLETETGTVVTATHQASAETAEDARRRAIALLRALTVPTPDEDAGFDVVPPSWRERLETGDHAIYQARVGNARVLEALVSRETQEVADVLDATVEQLEAHVANRAE